MSKYKFNSIIVFIFISFLFSQSLFAKTATQIDREVDIAIENFKKEVEGGDKFLPKIKAYLVFPSVIKGGFFIGGEYGEGALRVDGETLYYYSMASASIGFQIGAQEHSLLIAFISDEMLSNFIMSSGWEAGVDGSIALSEWGQSRDITSISYEKPIIAFVYAAKGMMASVSVEGTKFQKIVPN